MKVKLSNIFWGVIFILGGLVLLANQLNWIDFNLFSSNTWVYVFLAAGFLFLLGYFLSGLRQWGLLFPALVLASIGLTLWMSDRDLTGSYLGMPILLACAIPFFVGFFQDRKSWGLLIPAWVLSILAFITLAADKAGGNLVGAIFLYAVSLPFLIVFLMNRSRWWALIPAWTTFILGSITILSGLVDGNLIGALFLYSVALPFLVVYLLDRSRRWALIPAVAIAFIGTIPLLDSFINGDWLGVVVMLLFSALFLFVFFRWHDAWWSLIPAGIFASIAVTALLDIYVPHGQFYTQGISTAILLCGFGITFGILWLLRQNRPTSWAGVPALALLFAAVLAVFLGNNSNLFWPIALLAAGLILVVYSLLRRRPTDKV